MKPPQIDWNLPDSELATLHGFSEREIATRRAAATAGTTRRGRPLTMPQDHEFDWTKPRAELALEHGISYASVCKIYARIHGKSKRGRKPSGYRILPASELPVEGDEAWNPEAKKWQPVTIPSMHLAGGTRIPGTKFRTLRPQP